MKIPQLLQSLEHCRRHHIEILEFIKNQRNRLFFRTLKNKKQGIFKTLSLKRVIKMQGVSNNFRKDCYVSFLTSAFVDEIVDKWHLGRV